MGFFSEEELDEQDGDLFIFLNSKESNLIYNAGNKIPKENNSLIGVGTELYSNCSRKKNTFTGV